MNRLFHIIFLPLVIFVVVVVILIDEISSFFWFAANKIKEKFGPVPK